MLLGFCKDSSQKLLLPEGNLGLLSHFAIVFGSGIEWVEVFILFLKYYRANKLALNLSTNLNAISN